MADSIVVETRAGALRGFIEDGVASFRNVPYALPPVGELRFEPPQALESWSGIRDATQHGVLPPQRPSRLARVLGDYELSYGEDCLHLNIAAPSASDGKRPVLVWVHGGAFVTGGNSIPWYDGSSFARDHGIVFVGVNYRLGALGFLNADGVSPANLGLRDQHAALRWVQENIEVFGGDPNQVTLVGQSAGAISAFALLARDDSDSLFHRAILQSGRLSALGDVETARSAGEAFVSASNLNPSQLRHMPLEALLDLQVAQMRAGASEFAKTLTPFWPCADGEFIPTNTVAAAVGNARNKPIMIGWTRDEMAAFFADNEQILNGGSADVQAALEREWGENWREGEDFARTRTPGGGQDQRLDAAINECMFAGSSVMFAEQLMQTNPAWLYRFDWAAPGNPFGACHCMELPFVFNNADQWNPPMLRGSDPARVLPLSEVVQATWATFVKTGDPNNSRLPPWPRYEAERRWTLRIDDILETVGDLGGVTLPGRPRPIRIEAREDS